MPAKPTAAALSAALVLFGLIAFPLSAAAQSVSVVHTGRSGETKSPSPQPTSDEGQFSISADDEDEKEDEEEDEKETPSPSPTPSKSPTKKPGDDGTKSPTPKPSEGSGDPKPTPSAAVLGKPENHEDKPHDEAHEEVHDEAHEISTPPILIKPQGLGTGGTQAQGNGTNSSNRLDASGKYVSAPLGMYLDDSLLDSDFDSGAGVANFDTKANPPVIENIVATGYATPADEFMAKSYFGLGILGLAAGLLSFKAFGRRERDSQ